MKWFKNIETLEDLKKQYRELMKKYHPDKNPGNAEALKNSQEINNEYDQLFENVKNIRKNAQGETYKKEESTTETPDQFKTIINDIINFKNIEIEIIGQWIWISGNTYPIKDTLKKLHFNFAPKKKTWYFHFEEFVKASKKEFTMEQLRKMFGSQTIQKNTNLKLNGVRA